MQKWGEHAIPIYPRISFSKTFWTLWWKNSFFHGLILTTRSTQQISLMIVSTKMHCSITTNSISMPMLIDLIELLANTSFPQKMWILSHWTKVLLYSSSGSYLWTKYFRCLDLKAMLVSDIENKEWIRRERLFLKYISFLLSLIRKEEKNCSVFFGAKTLSTVACSLSIESDMWQLPDSDHTGPKRIF